MKNNFFNFVILYIAILLNLYIKEIVNILEKYMLINVIIVFNYSYFSNDKYYMKR